MASPQNPFTADGEPGVWRPEGPINFGEASSFGNQSLQIVKPPVKILFAAAAIAIVGILIAALFWESWPAIIGWFLSGPIAIGLLALYIKIDTENRSTPTYVCPDHAGVVYRAAWMLVVVGIVVTAWSFSLWVGHR